MSSCQCQLSWHFSPSIARVLRVLLPLLWGPANNSNFDVETFFAGEVSGVRAILLPQIDCLNVFLSSLDINNASGPAFVHFQSNPFFPRNSSRTSKFHAIIGCALLWSRTRRELFIDCYALEELAICLCFWAGKPQFRLPRCELAVCAINHHASLLNPISFAPTSKRFSLSIASTRNFPVRKSFSRQSS